MTPQEKVIATAQAEIGYKEKASNANLDDPTANAGSGNYTKYARDLDNISGFYNGRKNGYAWCDIFVDWLFVQCFGVAKAKVMLYQFNNQEGAGCTYSLGYYRVRGAFYSDPQPGDQIFFGKVSASTHTGIVVKVDDDTVYTVEGNTSDGVYARSYSLGASNIAGYGRPNWSVADSETIEETNTTAVTTQTTVKTTTTSKCSISLMVIDCNKSITSDQVLALQVLLTHYGCHPGFLDGETGPNTLAAVKKFQEDHDLTVDGIVGKDTWNKLLGVT